MFDCLRAIDWEQAYENLRREALGAGPRGHGLALFLSRGMMAWLRALTALEPRPIPVVGSERETVELPEPVNADWTLVFAGMVLSCLEREAV